MKFKLNESSLNRLREYAKAYDIACLSADKYLPDRNEYDTQKEYEDKFISRLGKQKKLDSKALMLLLKSKFNTIISIKGFYQYNSESIPSKEKSYCVINTKEFKDFKQQLLDIAVKAKQNSFYYVPAGTFEGYWVYTGIDLSEEDEIDKYHSYGDEDYRGEVHFGTYSENEEGTGYSLINGRPFSSYNNGNIRSTIKKVKTKNISKNITIIDECIIYDSIPQTISKEQGNYLSKFKGII